MLLAWLHEHYEILTLMAKIINKWCLLNRAQQIIQSYVVLNRYDHQYNIHISRELLGNIGLGKCIQPSDIMFCSIPFLNFLHEHRHLIT